MALGKGHTWTRGKYAKPRNAKTTTIEGTTKTGRPRKRWKDEVEEDLNIMGIKHGRGRQGSSEMEEDCVGSQGPQQTVVLEEEERDTQTQTLSETDLNLSSF
jgi:hypothetical protein